MKQAKASMRTFILTLAVFTLVVLMTNAALSRNRVLDSIVYGPSFDYPGAGNATPNDINSNGIVVGYYADSLGTQHGFAMKNGQFKTFDPAGSIETEAWGINDKNEIVGLYVDANNVQHGFFLPEQQIHKY